MKKTLFLIVLAALVFGACGVDDEFEPVSSTTYPEEVIRQDGDLVVTSTKTVFVYKGRASAGGEVWQVSQELLKYYRGGGSIYVSGQLKLTAGVKNLAYDKVVGLRYTKDGWKTQADSNGFWSRHIAGNNTDEFICLSDSSIMPGTRVVYAIYYKVNGKTYWDNNGGRNYSAQF
jgi:hypothetical protein